MSNPRGPEGDRRGEPQDARIERAAHGDPGRRRRHAQRESQHQVRERGEALGEGVKEYNRQRQRAPGGSTADSARRAAKTKTSAETATKPQVKPRDSTPAGRWRMRVRGLRASISASIRRLKAMAAERAPTMATTIQPIFDHAAGARSPDCANGQQRPGQRERQGKDGVLELDHLQREPDAFPHELSKAALPFYRMRYFCPLDCCSWPLLAAAAGLRREVRRPESSGLDARNADRHTARRPEDPRRSGDERRRHAEGHDVSRLAAARPRDAVHPPDARACTPIGCTR